MQKLSTEKRRALMRAYVSKHYAANSERVKERNRKYYAANPDKRRAAYRKWAAANPEKIRKRCGLPEPTRPMPELCEMNCGRKAICLDHCHLTDKFRGWLCRQCNTGIGLLGDSSEGLRNGLGYLARTSHV